MVGSVQKDAAVQQGHIAKGGRRKVARHVTAALQQAVEAPTGWALGA